MKNQMHGEHFTNESLDRSLELIGQNEADINLLDEAADGDDWQDQL
jgi:hypothetical protein